MKKKSNKKDKKYSQDHVAVILEDMQSQFKAFGDGQKGLIDEMKMIKEETETIKERLESLTDKVNENHIELLGFKEETKNNFKAVAENFSEMNDKIDDVQNDVRDIKQNLSTKVEQEDFNKLEKRVVKVERLALANN